MRGRLMAGILLAAVCKTGCTSPSTVTKIQVQAKAGATSGQRTPESRQETPAELHSRAVARLRAGEYPKALELCDRILESNPRDAYALYNRANALALSDRKAEAVDSLRRSIDAAFTESARFTRDPGMLALRGEEAFQSLLREFDAVLEEERAPRLENIKRILAEPRYHQFLPLLLPRYRSSELTGDTLRLLEGHDPQLQRLAIISLLHQNADETTTRAKIAVLLGSPMAVIREAAAEYFLWHGTEEDREALGAAAEKEQDPFALAAERAALQLVATRAGWGSPLNEDTLLPTGTSSREALRLLRARPTPEVLRQVAEVYRRGWSLDPKLVYEGMNVDARVLAEHHDRFNLTAAVFGFLRRPPSGKSGPSKDVPRATSFMAPVRNYFNPWRQSFGAHTGSTGPFAGGVHCGDDVAWYSDDGTVVAVADGVVRRISHTYSWGFIVIVEHRLPKTAGHYCSLYAHLAPSISVATGQVVTKGQRIASVGRSFTWENGGYPAHLHFGIHRGPYLQSRPSADAGSSRLGDASSVQDLVAESDSGPGPMTARPDSSWITGYLGYAGWAAGRHGWVNPQEFINARAQGPVAP